MVQTVQFMVPKDSQLVGRKIPDLEKQFAIKIVHNSPVDQIIEKDVVSVEGTFASINQFIAFAVSKKIKI